MTSEIETISTRKRTYQLGFWSAVLMTFFAAVSFAIAVATPPISGPFCRSGCVVYPYANVASFVPHDYIWMVPGIFLTPIFVVVMACIHQSTPDDKKIFTLIALSFALASAVAITMDYYIQLAVIQPSLLKGETEGLALFSQYNPHGIFIGLEDLGYLLMSAAFLFTAPVFARGAKLERSIFYLFITGSLIAIGAYILLSLIYGQDLEYRFEVMVITINWTLLMIMGILLGIFFKRVARQTSI